MAATRVPHFILTAGLAAFGLTAISSLAMAGATPVARSRCESAFDARPSEGAAAPAPLKRRQFVDDPFLADDVFRLLQSERAFVSRFGAASRIRLHRDSQGRILNRPVVLMFHGLLNSPSHLHYLEDRVYDDGAHVLNIRLPGHDEAWSERALDFATHEEWTQKTEDALALALRLGGKVTLVGQSLGGLLAANLAGVHRSQIAGLVLLAPAFKESALTTRKVNVMTSLGLSGWVFGKAYNRDRYMSTWAGLEVAKLARMGETPQRQAALETLPLLFVDTEADTTIALGSNFALVKGLAKTNPDFQHVILPASANVIHNQVGRFRHDFQTDLLETVLTFIRRVGDEET